MTVQIQTSIAPEIQRRFHKNSRWALAGSIVYESLKVTHCFLLLHVLPPALFGTIGSLLALLYFATYVADVGVTNSLPPFLHLFTKNRGAFKKFFLYYSLLPHMPFVIICAIGASYFIGARFSDVPSLGIIGSLVVLETVRSFLRFFLHTTFHAKHVVIVELSFFIVFYLGGIWLPYVLYGSPITPNHIFIPHLFDSAVVVIVFLVVTYRYYKQLPVGPDGAAVLPANLWRRLIATRLFNYLLRVGRNIFTGNFLTPLFAVRCGLAAAGLFYFASIVVSALQAIVKAIVGYSGNALLATVKNEGQHVKHEAFDVLCQKFVVVVFPLIALCGLNFKSIIRLSHGGTVTTYTLSILLLYLIISFMDFFFMLYEQFYIIEEAADRLFFFKVLEFALFYGLISSSFIASPILTLLGLVGIRSMSLIIITADAYYRWRIMPNFRARRYYVAGWIVVSLIISIALSWW